MTRKKSKDEPKPKPRAKPKAKPQVTEPSEDANTFLPGDEVEYIGEEISANGLPYAATITKGTRVTIIQQSVSVKDSYFIKPHNGFPNTVVHRNDLRKVDEDLF